jgi:hypothetical protein
MDTNHEFAAPVVNVTVSYTDEAGWVSDAGETCSQLVEGAQNAEEVAERCETEGDVRVVTTGGPIGADLGRYTANDACPRSCLTAIPPTVRVAPVASAWDPGDGWTVVTGGKIRTLRAPDVFPPAFQPGHPQPPEDADEPDTDDESS